MEPPPTAAAKLRPYCAFRGPPEEPAEEVPPAAPAVWEPEDPPEAGAASTRDRLADLEPVNICFIPEAVNMPNERECGAVNWQKTDETTKRAQETSENKHEKHENARKINS